MAEVISLQVVSASGCWPCFDSNRHRVCLRKFLYLALFLSRRSVRLRSACAHETIMASGLSRFRPNLAVPSALPNSRLFLPLSGGKEKGGSKSEMTHCCQRLARARRPSTCSTDSTDRRRAELKHARAGAEGGRTLITAQEQFQKQQEHLPNSDKQQAETELQDAREAFACGPPASLLPLSLAGKLSV